MIFQVLQILMTGLLSFGMGGDKTGNGGDAIVCRDETKTIKSAELLDYYEGRVLRGIHAKVGIEGQSYQEMVEILLKRIAVKNPSRANLYREWYQKFFSEAVLLPAITLVDIPDSQHIAMPVGCGVEQIAVQMEPRFPQDKRYTLSKDLWDSLSELGKAGLLIHELMYREFITEGATDSVNVRYLNSLYAANMVADMKASDYLQLMKTLNLSTIDIVGVKTELKSVEYNEDGSGRTTLLCCDLRSELYFQDQRIPLVPGSVFEWHANEVPKRFFPAYPFSVRQGNATFWVNGEVTVAANGIVVDGLLNEDASFPISLRDRITCAKNAYVDFYENGRIESCTPRGGQEQSIVGDYYKLKINAPAGELENRIKFNAAGEYLSVYRQSYVSQGGVLRWRRDKNIQFGGAVFSSGKILFQESWRSVEAPIFDDESRLKFVSFKNKEVLKSGEKLLSLEKGEVGFFMSGKISSAVLAVPQTFNVNGRPVLFQPRSISFYEDGPNEVQSGYLSTITPFELQNKQVKFGFVIDTCPKRPFFEKPCFRPTPINLTKEGMIMSGPLAESVELLGPNNVNYEYKKFTILVVGDGAQVSAPL